MLLLHPLTVLRSSDVTEGHRASCRRRQDTIFLPPGLPAQVILWDCCCCCIHGNEPLQLPSTLAPLTGWLACMDEACALPWLVLSVPGMGSGSTLQKTQLAVCTPPPPIMHTPAVFHMTGSYRTQRPCSPVKWMSVPECLTDSHAMLASLCALATLKKKENLQNKNLNVQSNICTCCKNRQILHHCFFFSGLSELFSLFSQSAFFFFFASHPFWGGAFQRRQMKRKYPVYNPVSRHFCPLIWFSAASVPALQPR